MIDNKLIVKNTFCLYLRMLMVMIVSLFTVKIILNALGPLDYGINNIVGGVVAMFTFLNSILSSAMLRFFTYNLGRNDWKCLSDYFSISFWCFAIMSLVVVVVAETLGLWFVKSQLNIPEGRIEAALCVFHFSVFTFVANLLVIPYNAIVVAYERMSVFAILGIIECLLKLGVAFLLIVVPFDKLKSYAVLMFLMMVLVDLLYAIYGLCHFPESRVRCVWNKEIFKEIFSFSGWTTFGAVSGVLREQGVNIMLNIFFNPIVNAARAIAYQVNNCLKQFIFSFYKSVQPQIIKNFAAGEVSSMHALLFCSSRLLFYMIFILAFPLLLEMDYVLIIWLKNVPENTSLFTRLVIVGAVVDSISYPLQTAISATGKIKLFQIVTGGLLLLNLPLSWVCLSLGCPPESTMYIAIALSVAAQISRVGFSKFYTNLSIARYVKDVILRLVLVAAISSVLPILIHIIMDGGSVRLICVGIATIVSCLITTYFLGISGQERLYINNFFKRKLHVCGHS